MSGMIRPAKKGKTRKESENGNYNRKILEAYFSCKYPNKHPNHMAYD
jgi:hypothetical protein